jgi:uncharacterized protein
MNNLHWSVRTLAALVVASGLLAPCFASDAAVTYAQDIQNWRTRADNSLRSDNGWLTLAGRWVLKEGVNTLGTAEGNNMILPKGSAPAQVGSFTVKAGVVTFKAAEGVTLQKDGTPFTERQMGTELDKRDWVQLGRLQMHIIKRTNNNKTSFVLRLADNENELRKAFKGRVWFDVAESYKVEAVYTPHKAGNTVAITNVLGEVSEENSPGKVSFNLAGKTYSLDAVADPGDKDLFFILKDQTAGAETYGAARFLTAAAPADLTQPARLTLDFNKAYNPPCAFSAYTTCPLPPEQNKLAVRVEAGEKYRKPE